MRHIAVSESLEVPVFTRVIHCVLLIGRSGTGYYKYASGDAPSGRTRERHLASASPRL